MCCCFGSGRARSRRPHVEERDGPALFLRHVVSHATFLVRGDDLVPERLLNGVRQLRRDLTFDDAAVTRHAEGVPDEAGFCEEAGDLMERNLLLPQLGKAVLQGEQLGVAGCPALWFAIRRRPLQLWG